MRAYSGLAPAMEPNAAAASRLSAASGSRDVMCSASEEARHEVVAEPQQRALAERMAVTAADVDDRRLAVFVDAIEVGLQHRAAPGREQPFDVREGLVALDALIAGGIARPGADRRA